jgi:hypothetical protein
MYFIHIDMTLLFRNKLKVISDVLEYIYALELEVTF